MQKLKDALGVFGYILYFAVMLLMAVMPSVILDFPIWLMVVIEIALNTLPFLAIPYIGIEIWALVVAIGRPMNVLTIAYFVYFAVRAVLFVVTLFQKD